MSLVHRSSPHHTPDRPPPSHLWTVAVYVVDQQIRRTGPHLLHHPRHSVLYWNCGCRDILLWVSVPDPGTGRSSCSPRQQENSENVGDLIPPYFFVLNARKGFVRGVNCASSTVVNSPS